MKTILVMLGLVVAAVACGGSDAEGNANGDDTALEGTYADKCELACKPKSNQPCASEDTDECARDCVTTTEGLGTACAQCIVESSGFYGTICGTDGTSRCSFGRGYDGECSPTPDPTCTPKCSGYEIAKASEGRCKDVCANK